VQEAYRTIQQAAPHSRDFYVQANSAEAWKQAHAEHVARPVALEKVRKEPEAICLHVIDSGKGCLKVRLISNRGCLETGSLLILI
jgi:hypothetical protein